MAPTEHIYLVMQHPPYGEPGPGHVVCAYHDRDLADHHAKTSTKRAAATAVPTRFVVDSCILLDNFQGV